MPYSPYADTKDATVITTMDDATPPFFNSIGTLLSNSSHTSTPLPLFHPQALITPAIDQHIIRQCTSNHHRQQPTQGAPMPTITATHSTTNISLHKVTMKTTEKYLTLLCNLHGNYHYIPTNHHHHTSMILPALSLNCSTTDQLSTVASQTYSYTPVHLITTIAQAL